MKRAVVCSLALLAVLPSATNAKPAGRGTAVGIDLTEWAIAVGRSTVPAGKVRFNIENIGEDGHNFVVRGPKGRTIKTLEEIGSGTQVTLPAKLGVPGTYTLVCTLSGHEDLGMKSTLKVTRKTR